MNTKYKSIFLPPHCRKRNSTPPRRMMVPQRASLAAGSPHDTLLNFVQFLINQQRQKREQKYARSDAEYAHGDREFVNPR